MTSPSRRSASHSPASPRLPSPPPFPEVQIGPRSPSPSSTNSSLISTPDTHPAEDYGAARRIRTGTKAADMALGPPLVPLSELDSAFQLQEHLKSLYLEATTSPSSPNHTQPITRASATTLATPPTGIDRSLWLYELCRFLVQRTNILIVDFFADSPPCSAANCPEMRASEWQYLCAVHDPPKSCCAIDYCCHTLDWAAGVLTSQRHFPSRLTLGSGSSKEGSTSSSDAASVRQLTNIFRRVYRMFAHAWFQHRNVFWAIENQEGLYVFYKTVCDAYSLIPEESYTIPPEAEATQEQEKASEDGEWTREILHGTTAPSNETTKPTKPASLDLNRTTPSITSDDYSINDSETQSVLSTGATTRRHKHTPSTGSFVTTIQEGDEESPSAASFSVQPSDNAHPAAQTLNISENPNTTTQAPKTARLIDDIPDTTNKPTQQENPAPTSKDSSNDTVEKEHKTITSLASSTPSIVVEPINEIQNDAASVQANDSKDSLEKPSDSREADSAATEKEAIGKDTVSEKDTALKDSKALTDAGAEAETPATAHTENKHTDAST